MSIVIDLSVHLRPQPGATRRAVTISASVFGASRRRIIAGAIDARTTWARDTAMWAAHRLGKSYEQIARALRIDRRGVIRAVRRADARRAEPYFDFCCHEVLRRTRSTSAMRGADGR